MAVTSAPAGVPSSAAKTGDIVAAVSSGLPAMDNRCRPARMTSTAEPTPCSTPADDAAWKSYGEVGVTASSSNTSHVDGGSVTTQLSA